jgi:hypothetical protein
MARRPEALILLSVLHPKAMEVMFQFTPVVPQVKQAAAGSLTSMEVQEFQVAPSLSAVAMEVC